MTSHRTLNLAVTGGGTGGHTYPALTTITTLRDRLAQQGTTLNVTWYGDAQGLEARICQTHDITFRPIATGKVRRSLKPAAVLRTLTDMARVPYGILQAAGSLARHRPDVVLSTGGYVAVPVGLGAALTRRPLVMHEQITAVGLANRVLARVATAVALSHDSSRDALPRRARSRAKTTGNPVRYALLHGDAGKARAAYGLDPAVPLIYVTGGAQGSAQINALITDILPTLLPTCQVLHQCGPDHHQRMLGHAAGLDLHLAHRYRPVPYIDGELADVFAAADLIVSRAGAGTLAELTAIGKPSVLIPLEPTAADEQRHNAEYLAGHGAAIAITRPNVTARRLGESLQSMIADAPLRADMAAKARALGHPDAADALADLVLAHARTRRQGGTRGRAR
ncbi:UDP-N-acetylglucosamine--N-acetylmuramyl-(pentapeptide) pyrophosphoryl-undecaprenol N-acetylglucosamine transferase [Streptomyces sp. NBC_00243]|uniref:UDP-N-acetylglucosamine--N-acetylmuramyl- (pentapeptide) pyrophosphoryl-undecaprenol N-acetylglucosamine transferase n=1 Tax=Streptomyces sp. NBC_00243 TaxID=2975688 RepID=UPI002DDB4FF6|nr:UDP-N-acetylglucosamine--N-acetylmuramyl-(pentapeptide) pyrophosphoryl-undecaprenol N-acetylglucosamine transferase [Streptomyces sp. NBC_00243]WRZ24327.1 UDP-N-acetylglucosamine--N-acetylmuramyl-(pentapeptide) pyrophosphoryl-undecaprenol N-acetylglucosamine transferase [Streptomyces sp. NBC_00243]